MPRNLMLLLLLGVCIEVVLLAPVDPKKKEEENHENKVDNKEEIDDYGLEYGKYLKEVIEALEEDKEFAKKLENVTADDVKSGKIARELEFVNHKVRNRLDELKRMELERLRKLARQEMERNDLGIDRKNIKMPQHLNLRNPSTFEVEDLMHLIKSATRDLEKLDQQRREEFKKYEMEKEHQYQEQLKHMSEEERKAAEAKHQEMKKKHKDHPKIHHPGSKPQLEQVWEEQDHLPKEEFDPKTFFAMHDVNGDGFLDEQEVEAILSLEIKKMYDPNNEEDDPVEMMEEYNRMREHIYRETDTNRDGLISKKEFDDMVKRADFEKDEGWKGLDEQQVYTDEEYREYERQLAMQQGLHYPPPPGMQQGMPPQHYQGGPPPPHMQQGMPQQGYQGGVPHPQQSAPHQQQQYQGAQQHGQQQYQGVPQHGQQQYQGVPQHGQQQYQGVPQHGQQQYQGVPQHGQQQYQGVPQHGQQQYQGVPQHGQQQYQGVPQHGQQQYQGVPQHAQQGMPPQHGQQGVPVQQQHMGVPQGQYQGTNMPVQQQQQYARGSQASPISHKEHNDKIGAGDLPQSHPPVPSSGSTGQPSSNIPIQQGASVPQQQQVPVKQQQPTA